VPFRAIENGKLAEGQPKRGRFDRSARRVESGGLGYDTKSGADALPAGLYFMTDAQSRAGRASLARLRSIFPSRP